MLGTCAFALQESVRPDVKVTKSALLGTVIRIGDVEARPEEAIELLVKMSKCTAVVRPPSLKKFARRSDPDAASQSQSQGLGGSMDVDADADDEGTDKRDVYAQLSMQTEYFVSKGGEDEDAADRMMDEDEGDGEEDSERAGREESHAKVDKDALIRGFRYGSSYAPCPDGQFPRLDTKRGIDVVGFFPDTNVRTDFLYQSVNESGLR